MNYYVSVDACLAGKLLSPAPSYDWQEVKVFLVRFVAALFHSTITYFDITKTLLIQAAALIGGSTQPAERAV